MNVIGLSQPQFALKKVGKALETGGSRSLGGHFQLIDKCGSDYLISIFMTLRSFLTKKKVTGVCKTP